MPKPPRLHAAPLRSAVCELRFPPLSKDLADEQIDALRAALDDDFPIVEARTGVEFRLTPSGLQNHETRALQLLSPDREHAVTVARDLFTFETTAYETVDRYVEQWQLVARAVTDVLALKWRQRLGTRYVNQLPVPSEGGHVELNGVVAAPLIATLGSHDRTRHLVSSLHEERFRQESGSITIRHGLQRPPEGAPFYLLDFDHYDEQAVRLDIASCAEEIVAFNEGVFELLRWAVTDEQFARFEPDSEGVNA